MITTVFQAYVIFGSLYYFSGFSAVFVFFSLELILPPRPKPRPKPRPTSSFIGFHNFIDFLDFKVQNITFLLFWLIFSCCVFVPECTKLHTVIIRCIRVSPKFKLKRI